MKSAVEKLYIVPTGILTTRRRKFLVEGVGWLQMEGVAREDYALRVKAVLDPDHLSVDIIKIITGDYIGTTSFQPNWKCKTSVLKFKKERYAV